MILIVTVKLPRKKIHNPRDKKFGTCRCRDENTICSDRTGEHHSFIMIGDTYEEIERRAKEKYRHLTRIEHPHWNSLGLDENLIEEMIEE